LPESHLDSSIVASRLPERVTWAVDQLRVRPTDHVLEIGCGNGVAASLICARLTTGHLTAIDRSATAIAAARKRLGEHLDAGRVSLLAGSLAGATLRAREFDRALAVNVNVFWLEPEAALEVLARAMKPNGLLCLVYQPPRGSPIDRVVDGCSRHLRGRGFKRIRSHSESGAQGTLVCISARAAPT
jgi:ubiquinone/menaquinone biosynthesis C-methylase UbiE